MRRGFGPIWLQAEIHRIHAAIAAACRIRVFRCDSMFRRFILVLVNVRNIQYINPGGIVEFFANEVKKESSLVFVAEKVLNSWNQLAEHSEIS